MRKVEIFDPAMCCSTGVCGPSVDPELTRVASAIYSLEKKGFNTKRYQLTNDPGKFAENSEVNNVLHEKGPDALPIILVDNQVVRVGLLCQKSRYFYVNRHYLQIVGQH
ncbi:arsenite efflux transporter metallochaperone ArsD [Cytobacillus praedii]|uniref:Arsenite efflux transporter metallochaperone ArsD n=1 Tax=Cytobacillus praedii TaxID=1742358 RepID=A0A4R1AN93_9BACI|nr:arsenite efflux transporter metallochaperone ArsD [Cytobacillus praedii]TCJ01101.1 arsenite efflux transporter metallochaperone ArsD [Cytobacillus praedii]